jgi:hypothetical protein
MDGLTGHTCTAWRLFNAVTFALMGKGAENPSATKGLHLVMDLACEQAQPKLAK